MQCPCYWNVCAKMSVRKNEDLKEEVKMPKYLQGMSLSRVYRGIFLCYMTIVQSFNCFEIVFEIKIRYYYL